ncbi:MAG: caspase family protein [Alphaproteobacteria bacterium]|nr:caspase family protein [Alphaproteobacteria bacterium]
MIALLASVAFAQPPRVAVIVTGNRGLANEAPLRFADSDGDRVADALVELGGFRRDAVVRIAAAGREDVERGLAEAVVVASRLRDTDEAPELLVYYAGHAGADGLHLDGEVLPLPELKAAARVIPAGRRVYVLDACRSGQLMRSMGATLESVTDAPADFAPPADEAWIASTGPEQDAFEADQRKGALFSHFFVSGLRGSADTDHDSRVTLREVYDFAQSQTAETAARTGRVQEPRWAGAHGDWPVSNLHRAAGGIETAGPVPYDLLVVEERTSRVAAEIPAGSGFRIALPRGRYQLVALDGDVPRVAHVTVRDGFEKLAPAVALEKSPGIRARGGLLVRNAWTVRGGYEVWTGGIGARSTLHGPWAELHRELGGGHQAGIRVSGAILPVHTGWTEGRLASGLAEATWALDLLASPWIVGPQAGVGMGYVQQRLARTSVPGLDGWYGADDGVLSQGAGVAVVRGGLRAEAPIGPVAVHVSSTVGSWVAFEREAKWRPGIGLAVGLGTRP